MRSAVDLAVRPDFRIRAVSCREHHRAWSPTEAHEGYGVVLVRRGRFRRSANGVSAVLDSTLGYVAVPGLEERFAHPVGGDDCTSVEFGPEVWRDLAGDGPPRHRNVYVDAELDLAHRRFLRAAKTGDVDYALVEQLLSLLNAILRQSAEIPGSDPARLAADRRLVDRAREAIAGDESAAERLFTLAELLGVSPYRLSRVFQREVGVSLTRYRNRVRVGRALDRLESGETDLAGLAVALGFADQAHLCRTVRAHVGATPTALRRRLMPAAG